MFRKICPVHTASESFYLAYRLSCKGGTTLVARNKFIYTGYQHGTALATPEQQVIKFLGHAHQTKDTFYFAEFNVGLPIQKKRYFFLCPINTSKLMLTPHRL